MGSYYLKHFAGAYLYSILTQVGDWFGQFKDRSHIWIINNFVLRSSRCDNLLLLKCKWLILQRIERQIKIEEEGSIFTKSESLGSPVKVVNMVKVCFAYVMKPFTGEVVKVCPALILSTWYSYIDIHNTVNIYIHSIINIQYSMQYSQYSY